MRAPIRVLVVDDRGDLARHLDLMLSPELGVQVHGPVTDADGAVGQELAGRPDVVVVGLSDARARSRTIARCREHDVIALVPSTMADELPAALAAGASGVLPDGDAAAVLDGLRRATAGELVLPVDHLSSLVSGMRPPAAGGLGRLTDREREVLHLFAEGLGTAEVAQRLGISVGTVRSHAKNVLSKLGVHSKVEAVRLVLREGLALADRAS